MPLTRKRFSSLALAAAGAQDVAWAVTDAITGHHRAATRLTSARVASSDTQRPLAEELGRRLPRPMGTIEASRQTTMAPIRRPSPTGRTNGRKICAQIGANTLRGGMCNRVCDRVHVAHAGGALRMAR